MKKTRLIVSVITALLILLLMVPALAEEGGGSMDVSPGDDQPPVVTEPDPTEPPATDPTPPPVEPTDEPTAEPTSEPTDEPTSEPTDGPTDEPTSEPTDEPTMEPTDEPTAEPTPVPPPVSSSGGSNQGSATRPSVNIGGGIRQPNTSSRRPSVSQGGTLSGSSSGSQAPYVDGPQYVTFARVTQKSNAMSRTLFYGGAACIGAGVLGLGVLAVFIIRGRHVDDREGIIAEIEQSAIRQAVRQPQPVQRRQAPPPAPAPYEEDDPYAQYDNGAEDYGYEQQEEYRDYVQGYDSPAPSLHHPEPEELAVPINGSMYTEEFEIPAQSYEGRDGYSGDFQPPRETPPARGPILPTQASVYTEEFVLPKPAPQRPKAPPQPAPKAPPEQMDTQELLREILHGDDK